MGKKSRKPFHAFEKGDKTTFQDECKGKHSNFWPQRAPARVRDKGEKREGGVC